MEQTLVTIVQNEARVDSRIIAKGLGISHRAFIQTIRKYQNKLETLGFLSFEMTKTTTDEDGRGRPETFVMLNEDQVTFAMQLSRNTEQVVDFKFALTQAFSEAKRQLLQYPVKRPRGRPRKQTALPQDIEHLEEPPHFTYLDTNSAALFAEEITESYNSYEDYGDLAEILFEYLYHMNEPLTLFQLREQETFSMIPVRILKIALQDCTAFGNLEKVKIKQRTCYQVPDFLKPASRAIVVSTK